MTLYLQRRLAEVRSGGEQLTDHNTPPRLTPTGHMTLFRTRKGMLPAQPSWRQNARSLKYSPGWPSPTDSDVKRKQSASESGSLGKPFSWPFIFLSARARFAIKLALARLVGLRRRAAVARGLGISLFFLSSTALISD